MPTTRRKTTRSKKLDPTLYSFFSHLGAANMLKKQYGEKCLKRLWAEHGRPFLDNWPHERPPLILSIYGEPETTTTEE